MAKAKKTSSGRVQKKTATPLVQNRADVEPPAQHSSKQASPNDAQLYSATMMANETLNKTATVSITAVRDVHIVEIEVNTVTILIDTDAQKDQVVTGTEKLFPSRPLSFYIHLTGMANTSVAVELQVDTVSEFKGDIFIPASGNLVTEKIIT